LRLGGRGQGHSKACVTLDTYGHLIKGAHAAAAIERALKDKGT
jgi:hypothetical protein